MVGTLLKFQIYLLSGAIYLVSWNYWWKILHLLHSFFFIKVGIPIWQSLYLFCFHTHGQCCAHLFHSW